MASSAKSKLVALGSQIVCDLPKRFVFTDRFVPVLGAATCDKDDRRVLKLGIKTLGEGDGACEFKRVVRTFTGLIEQGFTGIESIDDEVLLLESIGLESIGISSTG
jgi:hypothetical protein